MKQPTFRPRKPKSVSFKDGLFKLLQNVNRRFKDGLFKLLQNANRRFTGGRPAFRPYTRSTASEKRKIRHII